MRRTFQHTAITATLVVCCLRFSSGAEEQKIPVLTIEVSIADTWYELPEEEGRGVTYSAIPLRQAVRGFWRRPVDMPEEWSAYPGQHLRRIVSLEKSEFRMGEPILLEYRVEFTGDGIYREHARSRGGLHLLMRRHDGTWVGHTIPLENYHWLRVGLSTKGDTNVRWLSVQEQLGITEPGRYDLYVVGIGLNSSIKDPVGVTSVVRNQLPEGFRGAFTYSDGTAVYPLEANEEHLRVRVELDPPQRDTPSMSPIFHHIDDAFDELWDDWQPELHLLDSRRKLGKDHRELLKQAELFAHFEIVIREPSEEDQEEVYKEYGKFSWPGTYTRSSEEHRKNVIGRAMLHSRTDLYLDDLLALQWEYHHHFAQAFLFHPNVRATRHRLAQRALGWSRMNIYKYGSPHLIDNLIELIEDEDDLVGSRAVHALQRLQVFPDERDYWRDEMEPFELRSIEEREVLHPKLAAWWAEERVVVEARLADPDWALIPSIPDKGPIEPEHEHDLRVHTIRIFAYIALMAMSIPIAWVAVARYRRRVDRRELFR